MSIIYVGHIKTKLDDVFINRLDMSDYDKKDAQEREKAFLTRSYAAYSLMVLASASSDDAANAIVDGYGDNGIDAIFYNQSSNELWIVQSKWISSGNGEPSRDEIIKFCQGITHLIDFKMDKFNKKIRDKEDLILKALNDYTIKIKIVLAYTGRKIGNQSRELFDDLIKEYNEISDLISFYEFSLGVAHKALAGSIDGDPINVDILVQDWGQIEEPFKAFYGQVSADVLAEWWNANRTRLFSDNIRSFVGLTEINESIQESLVNEPEKFIYLNNGVTVLCQKIHKKALNAASRTVGSFYCEGISIVNGAQTVGTIGSTFEKHPDKVSSAKVFIKLISLEDVQPDFGVRVTKATNTQNKVEKRDFVSLDARQESIRTELALIGVKYHYKRDEQKPLTDENNCTLEEATISIACSLSDVRNAYLAKNSIGKLWDDVTKPPYTDLFNDATTATNTWRRILVNRLVDKALTVKGKQLDDRDRIAYIHGNRFMLHMVLQAIPVNYINDPANDFDAYCTYKLHKIIETVKKITTKKLSTKFADKHVYHFFRNLENYRNLKLLVESDNQYKNLL